MPGGDIWDALAPRESCEVYEALDLSSARWQRALPLPGAAGAEVGWRGPRSSGRDVREDVADGSCSTFMLEMTRFI